MRQVRVPPPSRSIGTELDVGGATTCGTTRELNEDRFAVVELLRCLYVRDSNLPLDMEHPPAVQGYLLAVADGIGGHEHGELASQAALEALLQYAAYYMPWLTTGRAADATALIQGTLVSLLRRSQQELHDQTNAQEMAMRPGSTLTVAYVDWPGLCVFHVGDSRCYILRDGVLIPTTRDHTLAQTLIEQGMNPDEINPRYHHILRNAIGGSNEPFRPDVERFMLLPDDSIILCTDGVTDQLDPETIAAVVDGAVSADAASEQLVARADIAGGIDNATAVVARRVVDIPM